MYDLIVKEHRQLEDLLTTIHKDMLDGHSQGTIFNHLNSLVYLAEEHFKNEETLMNSVQYPQIAEHKKEHAGLLDQLKTMMSQLNGGQTPFGEDCLLWLENWLNKHISTADKELDDYLSQHLPQ